MPFKNKEDDKKSRAKWRDRNRHKLNKYHREWEAANPVKVRNFALKKVYGISNETYMDMLIAQHGVCAICLRPEIVVANGKLTRLSVDHCHATGKVRELLCRKCNAVLGQIGDSIDIALAIVKYLERHKTND